MRLLGGGAVARRLFPGKGCSSRLLKRGRGRSSRKPRMGQASRKSGGKWLRWDHEKIRKDFVYVLQTQTSEAQKFLIFSLHRGLTL